ncbi:MAG: extracellular solute-binding protein [Lachnospiraceae bacterium]|nr:extracellular solute-binding protein [Lachnospiraceae bacterium]MDE6982291.1 extracellular solute-binding protein [Lachnospiraceae bacterium]
MDSSRKKKEFSVYLLLLFGTVLMIKSRYGQSESFVIEKQEELGTQETESQPEDKVQRTYEPGEEITLWFYGPENKEFFENCADSFQEETGVLVKVKEQQSFNYFSGVYEASKSGELTPDVYLLPGEQLEQAYYTQILAENQVSFPEDCAEMAANTCSFLDDGKYYGYPLYFNTSVFAYRKDYFETAPASIQEIIDYSLEHEPGEGVEKLLEWDLSDPRCNYAFLGSGITFSKEEGCVYPAYEEEVYENCKTFFGNLTAVIALDEEEPGSRKVAEDFAGGRTVAALLSPEELGELEENWGVEKLPKLNDELSMCPVSETTVLCVNGVTEHAGAAQDFAAYASSLSWEEKLSDMTGHFPVIKTALKGGLQETAFLQYEEGRKKPQGLNVTDFWVKFQSQALKVWHDSE